MHKHTQTEVNRKRGVRVRGCSPNEKKNQHTKEPATGTKGNNVRKRNLSCFCILFLDAFTKNTHVSKS